MTNVTTPQTEIIDRILAEGPIGMAVAARLLGGFRGGAATHPSTVTRMCLRGVRLTDGRVVRLEHYRIAGRLMTSRGAVIRFLAEQQPDDASPTPTLRSPAAIKRDNAAAERELAAVLKK